jgi:hypothetical protein
VGLPGTSVLTETWSLYLAPPLVSAVIPSSARGKELSERVTKQRWTQAGDTDSRISRIIATSSAERPAGCQPSWFWDAEFGAVQLPKHERPTQHCPLLTFSPSGPMLS